MATNIIVAAAVGVALVAGTSACDSAPAEAIRTAVGQAPPASTRAFPQVDESTLTPAQRRWLAVVRAEYASPRPGTTYSDGVSEPWCADFVSWVSRESGTPLTNPNSGGWRVPGVFTLQEAFQAAGTWHPAGSGYTPKLGDVAIYRTPSPFGDHTNFVLGLSGDRLTTIGGNEPGDIAVTEHAMGPELNLLGFGAR